MNFMNFSKIDQKLLPSPESDFSCPDDSQFFSVHEDVDKKKHRSQRKKSIRVKQFDT